jgi:FkbM family methyltransferase
MRTHVIRKILRAISGYDVHRYYAMPDRLAWLPSAGIRTVFDIGANVGQFAAEIRYQLPDAQIYSFEPLSDCHQTLAAAFVHDPKFKSFNVAIGDTIGHIEMNRSSYSSSSSIRPMSDSHKRLFPHTSGSLTQAISVRTLDDVFVELRPEREILIKIDTQGYEDKVLAGGQAAFGEAKVVLIEASYLELYEGQPLFDDIYRAMRSLGFAYAGALSQNINKTTGEVLFEDAIFVKSQVR